MFYVLYGALCYDKNIVLEATLIADYLSWQCSDVVGS
jgi:hypothetical protein